MANLSHHNGNLTSSNADNLRRQNNAASGQSLGGIIADQNAAVDTDEYYMWLIEKYKGTEIYDQLLHNPYLIYNNEGYSPNWKQQIAGLFGLDNGEQEYTQERLSKRNNYLSELVAQHAQNVYDSPAEQVSRNNIAGINSDLVGTGNVAGAAENDQPASPLSFPSDTGDGFLEALSAVGNGAINFVSSIFGFIADAQALQSNNFDLVAKEIGLHTSAREEAKNRVLDEIQSYFDTNIGEVPELDDDVAWTDAINSITKIAEDTTYSKRTRKYMRNYINRFRPNSKGVEPLSIKVLRAELEQRWHNAYKGVADIRSTPGFDDKDIFKFVTYLGEHISQPLQDLNEAITNYQTKYYQNLDGVAKARAENAQAGANESMAKQQKSLYDDFNNVLKSVDTSFSNIETSLKGDKKHPDLAAFALMLLPMFKSTTKMTLYKLLNPNGNNMISRSLDMTGNVLETGAKALIK